MAGKKKRDRLKPREQLAIDRYLEHGKMAKAMSEAGFSEATSRHQCSRFFGRPIIAAAVQAGLDAEMTGAEVMHRLGIEAREAGEATERISALKLIGQRHKLFVEVRENTEKTTLADLVPKRKLLTP